jgi:hypothetical protein
MPNPYENQPFRTHRRVGGDHDRGFSEPANDMMAEGRGRIVGITRRASQAHGQSKRTERAPATAQEKASNAKVEHYQRLTTRSR